MPWHALPLQVLEVSRRLLQLQALLGVEHDAPVTLQDSAVSSSNIPNIPLGADLASVAFSRGPQAPPQQDGPIQFSDVVWMVQREPQLLTTDYTQVVRRLFEMKVQYMERHGTVRVFTSSIALHACKPTRNSMRASQHAIA